MRWWRWSAGAMLGAAALLAAGCGIFTPSHSYKYRVTVEVDTPQGLRSASSVWEIKAWEGSGIPDTAIRSKVSGEAVVVDLPGGPLFALLRGQDMNFDYASNIVYGHLYNHPQPDVAISRETDAWSKNMRAIENSRATFELYPDEYPILVRFRDINDPASVEKVDPSDLSAAFGPGLKVRRITVTVTDAPVTRGSIANRIPSLNPKSNSDRRMKSKFTAHDWSLAATIRHADFVRD